MLHRVAALLAEPVAMFELAVVAEVFGLDRTEDRVPKFDFVMCSATPGAPMAFTTGGFIVATEPIEVAAQADLVVVPGGDIDAVPHPDALATLRSAVERGVRVMSVCNGAFALGAAGLLDGRACTTHWRHASELARRYPAARVDPDVLYVSDGPVLTSAGTAAGIDACLHLVRTELGAAVAARIARRMVVPPQRDGGQRQFIEAPMIDADSHDLAPVLTWMSEHLAAEPTVADLARRAGMSERTFARRFAAEVGSTPHRWLVTQRVLHARGLLEASDLGIEQVARRSGFSSAALLRHHFRQVVGLSPMDYRKRFACTEATVRRGTSA